MKYRREDIQKKMDKELLRTHHENNPNEKRLGKDKGK